MGAPHLLVGGRGGISKCENDSTIIMEAKIVTDILCQ